MQKTMPSNDVNEICNQILGREKDGERLEGLVDSENEIEFEARYQQFKMWPDEFVSWLSNQ